jgi:hypothetical protein
MFSTFTVLFMCRYGSSALLCTWAYHAVKTVLFSDTYTMPCLLYCPMGSYLVVTI